MEFEFDASKSVANKLKHGIDFDEAQALWQDDEHFAIPSKYSNEPRSLVIGKIGDKIWIAIVTQRGEKTRIISVRRAHESEVAAYEKEKDD